jgi:DNA polymerase-3 subunit delta
MPAYLYWGEEEFNLENAVKELRSKVIDPNFAAMSHKKLDEPEVRDLIEAVQTLPMMFGNLLVEVNATTLFMRGNKKASSSDELMQKLFDVLENLNDRVHLLFVCQIPRESGKKVDGTLKLTKLLNKIGKVEEFPVFKFYEDAKIIDWITKQASAKGLKISRDSAAILLANAGTDLRKLDTELEKIAVMIHPKTQVSAKDLEEMVSTSENIFLLLELWIKGDKISAIKEMYKLFERNNPLKVLATVQTMTRRWLKIKVLSRNNNSFDIAKQVNSPKFVVEKDLEKLRNISEQSLILLRERAVHAEYKIKSGELLPENAMELLIAG